MLFKNFHQSFTSKQIFRLRRKRKTGIKKIKRNREVKKKEIDKDIDR